jgi:hypothetical protein
MFHLSFCENRGHTETPADNMKETRALKNRLKKDIEAMFATTFNQMNDMRP